MDSYINSHRIYCLSFNLPEIGRRSIRMLKAAILFALLAIANAQGKGKNGGGETETSCFPPWQCGK